MKNKHSILSKPPRPRLKPDGNRKLPSKQQMYITWNPFLIVLILFLVKTALRVLNVRPTYLTIFDWFRSVRIPFRTLLRTLLPSLVILLVTAHSDRQMSHRKFRIGRYTRANQNYSRDKSSPSVRQPNNTEEDRFPHFLTNRNHTSKWRLKNSRHANRYCSQGIMGTLREGMTSPVLSVGRGGEGRGEWGGISNLFDV